MLALAALAAAPRALLAQPPRRIARIGYLSSTARPPDVDASAFGGLVQGMRDLGHVEGKTFVMEWRFADGNADRFPVHARELVALKVDAIVTSSTTAARAAQEATRTIPIVLAASGDPVGSGLVKSLARPDGNITGVSQNLAESGPKSLELLKTVLPNVSRMGLLWNSANPASAPVQQRVLAGAPALGVQIVAREARTTEEIEPAIAALARERVGATFVMADGIYFSNRQRIVQLGSSHRMPMLFQQREYAELGGLMSYGQPLRESIRRAAAYVDKILKGAKPADLPIEQPTLYELVVNLRTAKALGITIPQSVLLRANRVIE